MARDSEMKHPLNLLLTRLPVPPSCIRPSVISEVYLFFIILLLYWTIFFARLIIYAKIIQIKSGSTEDDITVKLSEIMLVNEILRKYVEDGVPSKTINESWDHLQVNSGRLLGFFLFSSFFLTGSHIKDINRLRWLKA